MHAILVEDVTMMSYNILFCCVNVLIDAHLHISGCVGIMWEACLRIGIYGGYSPFNTDSVALVWNPITVRTSPTYHMVVDNFFTNVSYMEGGTLPPNW
jgi:hypothetical protein